MSLSNKIYSLFKNKYTLILMVLLSIFIGVVSAQEDVSCYHCHTKVVNEFRNNIHYDKGFNCASCMVEQKNPIPV
ncbi:MAG: hypothetical protein MPEBLZ_03538 [Candidatus Methanoperedens nitroreducens]|uniref:NapC/NirT cytochrome c N-terminal domain-containing protein n=1 Tax=Candidatus Methanoperedens nitratireducens TaxID=1392998 RepID=A0A0P7ZBH5_9EURY|nr:MAG: hypothetical protein MPEBLZ_03538 [Candidatus Methanoperedens sp. BLZ1]